MTSETNTKRTPEPIVYVREARRDALPDELQSAPGPFYALHDESGKMLALAPNRSVAFALARRNSLQPQSVH
ncbi:MAG: DUF1150 family protein [Pseudomonadota bacterium]